MVPNTAGTLVAFLFFVTPGLLFMLLAERRRPAAPGSTFREISTVGLISVVCTTIATAVLAIARARRPRWLLDPGRWVRDGSKYFESDYPLIARTLVIEIVLASCVALGLYWFFVRRPWRASRSDPNPVLWSITGGLGSAPASRPNTELFALARTRAGDIYQGYVVAVDLDPSRSLAMLALQTPIKFKRANDPPDEMTKEWDRLAIPLSDVQELWLQWVRGAAVGSDEALVAKAERKAEAITPHLRV